MRLRFDHLWLRLTYAVLGPPLMLIVGVVLAALIVPACFLVDLKLGEGK